MGFDLFDMVVTTVDVPESSIRKGMVGAIVDVYPDGEFEVEFVGNKGETIAMLTLKESQIKMRDMRHAA